RCRSSTRPVAAAWAALTSELRISRNGLASAWASRDRTRLRMVWPASVPRAPGLMIRLPLKMLRDPPSSPALWRGLGRGGGGAGGAVAGVGAGGPGVDDQFAVEDVARPAQQPGLVEEAGAGVGLGVGDVGPVLEALAGVGEHGPEQAGPRALAQDGPGRPRATPGRPRRPG